MNEHIFDKIHQLKYLTTEMDVLYHQASFKIGIADSAMRVLYTIHDNGESCLLSDIYKGSGISKQTVNSAIRKLENDQILYLEQYKGKTKKVILTDKGKEYILKTAARLYEAESKAFESWSENEIDMHIRLMEKYVDSFRTQVQELH